LNSTTTTKKAFSLLGFVGASDLTGSASYTGNEASGETYYPQFLLQSYVPPENWIESMDATINKSADGRVEVVRFGEEQKLEFEIKFITDLPMDGLVIKNNPSGLQDARDFLSYISQKKRFEFVPDVASTSVFYKVMLDKAPGSDKGTGFKLKELYTQNLPDVYETGILQLKVVT
jgi:hypothetical protein